MKDPRRECRDPAEIGHDPKAEEGEVQVDEPHAAGEAGDRIRDPFLDARLFLFPLTPKLQRLDVPLQHRAEAAGWRRRVGRLGPGPRAGPNLPIRAWHGHPCSRSAVVNRRVSQPRTRIPDRSSASARAVLACGEWL